MDKFGLNLKVLAKKMRLSQQEIADILELPRNTVWRWFNNRAIPSGENLQKLADLLQVSVDELLNGKNSEKWVLKIVIGDEDEEMVDLTHDMLHVTTLNATQNGVFIKMLGNWDAFMDDEKFNDLLEQIKHQRNEVLATGEHVFKINIPQSCRRIT